MSITYCSIIAKSEKILLAESSTSESFDTRIKTLLPTILKNNVLDVIEIENDNIVTYLRTKKIIFICVSKKDYGEERPRRFIENFASNVIKEFGNLDSIIPPDGLVSKLCLNNRLNAIFNSLVESYDTGAQINKSKSVVKSINRELDEIKHDMRDNIKKIVNNNNDLEDLLLTTQKINDKAKEYRENAKELEKETRCCKPWMIIVSVVFLVLALVYTIFAIYLCGSMTVFCDRKS